jgi:hypothetical protein
VEQEQQQRNCDDGDCEPLREIAECQEIWS